MKHTTFYYLLVALFMASCSGSTDADNSELVETPIDTVQIPEPVYEYGFCIDSFLVHRGEIEKDWTLSHLFLPHHVSQLEINQIAEMAKDSTIGLKYVSAGKPYVMLCKDDSTERAQYCIYDKNAYEYIVFDFTDSLNVYKVEREIDIEERTISGIIAQGSNLSNEVQNATQNINITAELVTGVANTYAWAIDFFRLHANDKFKVLYEEKSVEGKSVGMGNIKAIFFQHKERDYFAFRYERDGEVAFFDEEGNSMQTMFLKAPLKYSRLSSPYTKKRFHPVQKRWKAHLGTDYAAPKGTPIWSTADGTVIAATYSKYNGYYVKVKHNDTYTTQYLHMTKIAPGMKKGRHVAQGETIGYVGSTGLATGPHVCYRFWKNGKQIDHRQEVHQATNPIDEKDKAEYLKFIAPIKTKLDAIIFDPIETETDTLDVAIEDTL